MIPRYPRTLSFLLLLLLGGCVVGPDYQRPEVVLPEQWRVSFADASELSNLRWWQQLNDPVLDSLLETALQQNQDIRQAAARVAQFQGVLTSTRSAFYPQTGYDAEASRNRLSEQAPGFVGGDPYYNLYQAALGASWQLDLFGRVQRQSEAAAAQVYASEQGRRGVLLSVVTGVAAGYVTLRGLDEQRVIARRTAEQYRDTLTLFQLRHRYGTVSQLEVSQIESQYQQALAAIPRIESRIALQENLLSVLLGQDPGPIERGLSLAEMPLPRVPSGLPSTLLTRRPDLLQAEYELMAANAQVGVAESLYYPDISLSGSIGQGSSELNDLLNGSARLWGLGASITGPIFTFGRIEGQVASAEAARDAAEARYRQTLFVALQEVNDALTQTQKNQQTYSALERRTRALREYARLAMMRFESGAASYLEVLYANTELFQADLDGVAAQVDQYRALISVYQSMGGGWLDALAEPQSPPGSAL
ncbi:efflux transporter outer membrane subunit [Aestuariirhabdus litorea]|uniref:Efflux transporter outer membrane subunit n=1 Tax=Aestuariirhabdus litorea TaxID=2528527 RepID=A0A3P3VPY3_9GAMM|nr:efflux transporter outer membrane subunit [Aestuariirhabdus litorea]RRJ83998.1 efflux transporter outer membrane subunit [Aestuariirhabdus litorea]RWW97218.1 efflux transporter outer membrane subunit [Endozoicomonadaceae bacterium GTF-13]